MRKLLLLIPILIVLLACNIGASTNPTLHPTPTVQVTSTGAISGRLSYPSEFLPAMRVVAFSLSDSKAYFIDTAKGQGEFSIEVPAGTYYVVSYPHEGVAGATGQADSYALGGGPFAGGYTQMVPCGLSADCDDHTLMPVTVTTGQTATADPQDWYAPEGTFPPMPNP